MQINVNHRNYQLSRVAWLHVTGAWPTGDIDHIDGDPGNNRFVNLRDVPHRTNIENRKRATKSNGIGLLGVTPVGHRFKAQIGVGGITKNIGLFDTALEAHNAYLDEKRKYHKGCTI